MPWEPKDATRHTKKAKSKKRKRQFAHVANSMLERGYSERRAIMAANSQVKKAETKKKKKKHYKKSGGK